MYKGNNQLKRRMKNISIGIRCLKVGQRKKVKDEVQTEVAKFVELDHWTKDGVNQKARIRLTGEEREWRKEVDTPGHSF
jgi:hypothetical protein